MIEPLLLPSSSAGPKQAAYLAFVVVVHSGLGGVPGSKHWASVRSTVIHQQHNCTTVYMHVFV